MRNYVDFYACAITGTIKDGDGNITASNFLVIVEQESRDLESSITEAEQNPAFFPDFGTPWYFDEERTGRLYVLLNAENVANMLAADQGFLYQILTLDPQIFPELEGIIVDESPRKTWSHGH